MDQRGRRCVVRAVDGRDRAARTPSGQAEAHGAARPSTVPSSDNAPRHGQPPRHDGERLNAGQQAGVPQGTPMRDTPGTSGPASLTRRHRRFLIWDDRSSLRRPSAYCRLRPGASVAVGSPEALGMEPGSGSARSTTSCSGKHGGQCSGAKAVCLTAPVLVATSSRDQPGQRFCGDGDR